MRPIGRSLVVAVTVMVLATTVAITSAEDSSSDESLRQALVLVDILKSGILRRSQRRFAATPGSLADYAGYRPWPPPQGPSYGYGPPFRRVNNQGDFEQGKGNKNTRQMDYEDPYGPHPGGDEPETPEQVSEGSTSPHTDASKQPPNEDKDALKEPTKVTETTVAVTQPKLIPKKLTDPPSITKAKATKKSTPTKKKSKVTKSQTPTVLSPVKRKTKKPTKMNTKSKKNNLVNSKSTATGTRGKKGDIAQLKHKKKGRAKDTKRADEAEIIEAAMVFQREAADMGNISRCAARRTPRPLRTEPHQTTHTCSGPKCNEGNATHTGAARFKATTRVYLSRSVRPRIPLPANNAFCYTNPENALCRTQI